LRKTLAAEPVERKLWAAAGRGLIPVGSDEGMRLDGIRAGILTGPEGEALRQALEARREVIKVDDFPRVGSPKAGG